jgi:hypothetical protein
MFVEGLHTVGGPKLKYKYPFLYSFTCYVFIYVVTFMVLFVITGCMLSLLFLH